MREIKADPALIADLSNIYIMTNELFDVAGELKSIRSSMDGEAAGYQVIPANKNTKPPEGGHLIAAAIRPNSHLLGGRLSFYEIG